MTIQPVSRSKDEARQFYNRISRLYDCLAGRFEQKYAAHTLKLLDIQAGKKVLEIGCGTGKILKKIAQIVGNNGRAYGIDISEGMLRVTRNRLEKAGLMNRVELCHGDASKLPFIDETFDVVFMSFTLELFDTPAIPQLLSEVRRVLKAGGMLGVVSLSRIDGSSVALQIYEWIHRKWPKYVDCRPIYLEQFLRKAGYKIQNKEVNSLFVLPLEIVIATN